MLVDRRASVPAFSQSKASFSAMPRSFMLLSNTDMINCRGWGGQEDREVTPGLVRWKGSGKVRPGEMAGHLEGQ